MGEVIAHLAMSLDGFIAGPNDGCDELFGFYQSSDVAVKLSEGFPELHVSQTTANLLTRSVAKADATVVGRRLYDLTNGWDGHPGGEVPMVVVTHHPPEDWPRGGVPIFFETSVEAAVAKARELAGEKDVDIAGATITRGCLDAGLLDVIQVSLVPVILGEGIPWLAGTRGPVRLSDPRWLRTAASPTCATSSASRVPDLPSTPARARHDPWTGCRCAARPGRRGVATTSCGGHTSSVRCTGRTGNHE